LDSDELPALFLLRAQIYFYRRYLCSGFCFVDYLGVSTK